MSPKRPDRRTSALHAHRDHAFVFARRLHHLAALPNVVGHRLLHINVLARLAGEDRPERVPVIGRGVDQRVHSLVLQHSAKVLRGLGRPPLRLLHYSSRGLEAARVSIGQVGNFYILSGRELLHQRGSPPADTHEPNNNALVGAKHSRAGQHRQSRGRAHGLLQELSSS
jgi:hypothetical protein